MVLSFPVWYIMLLISILYRGISIFTLSLSIFILSYCILIVFSNFTVWNHFYFRSLSDRLSDLSKVSMMICRWYFLLIDFHTEGDFWSGKIFSIIYFWKFWGSNGYYRYFIFNIGKSERISGKRLDLFSVSSDFLMKFTTFVSNST